MEKSADVCYPRPFSYLAFISWALVIGAVLLPVFYINWSHSPDASLKAINGLMLVATPFIWTAIYASLVRNYKRVTPGLTPNQWHFIAWGAVQLLLQVMVAWLVSFGLESVLQKP